MKRVSYKDEAERQKAIDSNPGLYLVEDQIYEEGNYLVFDTVPPAPVVTVTDEIEDLKLRVAALEAAG
jgi:hypothetical protein